MNTGELILNLVAKNPSWSNQEVADEVRRRNPTARTTAASVSSVKSRAKSRNSAGKSEAKNKLRARRKGSARYKSMAIGNAQNWLVRNLLGRRGSHEFTKKDWVYVRDETFGGRCAYCGKNGKLEMDHAIPINMEMMGEHHLGNLVPACSDCNSRKSDSSYSDFLADQPNRIEAIERHMKRYDYQPLSGNESVRILLKAAHRETGALADRFAGLMNELDGKPG